MQLLNFKPKAKPPAISVAQQALDALAVALADHAHVWTPHERRLYEAATRAFVARKRA